MRREPDPQVPLAPMSMVEIRSPAVLQVLQLLGDELQECGGMELGEGLRIMNSGAQFPAWSVTTWIRSPASLLLHSFAAQTARAGDVGVEPLG